MKYASLCIATVLTGVVPEARAHEVAAEVSVESRGFAQSGVQSQQRAQLSLALEPEYSHSWNNDRQLITIRPFARVDQPDGRRTHWDIREFAWEGAWDYFELRIGASKVFWGVAESQHLVDVVNQTDLVENLDGEDKLGQPMVKMAYVSPIGVFEGFFLPYFRERTFPGRRARLRFDVLIDEDTPIYESDLEEWHPDFALRWSHTLGDLDFGVSYFRGTNRTPRFQQATNAQGEPVLQPIYVQSQQVGLDAQYIVADLLLKLEMLWSDSSFESGYFATVAGFEYTFVGLLGDTDVGVLAEYNYDSRGVGFLSGFQNDAFAGVRLAFNDTQSSELLVGYLVDTQLGSQLFRAEGSRRISDNWKLSLEALVFVNISPRDPLFSLRRDDLVQFTLSFFL